VSGIIDPITLYERKLAQARERLKGTFIVFINAPNPEEDNQGYILCGSHQEPDRDEFENFDAYSVGRSEGDIRDVSETLDFWDAEERGEHAPNGKDYHAIVAAKALAGYQRDILRDVTLPLALAVETVFFDTLTEVIVLHADGELERFDLDRKPDVRFLAGDDDPVFRRRVLETVRMCWNAPVMTEEEAQRALDAVKKAFGTPQAQAFALGQLCQVPSADDIDE
jgi:hypothetical protein